jgi:hypothetical protein
MFKKFLNKTFSYFDRYRTGSYWYLDADSYPDSPFHVDVDHYPNFYADPDPTFHFDADQDSDPASHFDADSDFAPHQSLRPLTCTLQTLQAPF